MTCLQRLLRQALSEEVRQANMPVEVCTAALQGVQEVLPFVAPSRRAVLLAAVCTLSSRSAARSGVKAACLAFQHRLLAKGGQALYPDPRSGAPLLPEAVLIEWLLVGSQQPCKECPCCLFRHVAIAGVAAAAAAAVGVVIVIILVVAVVGIVITLHSCKHSVFCPSVGHDSLNMLQQLTDSSCKGRLPSCWLCGDIACWCVHNCCSNNSACAAGHSKVAVGAWQQQTSHLTHGSRAAA